MLRERYSILVKQYSLSEEAFRFWNNLKESNESTGTLYDSQPFQVTGNIRSMEDPFEPVLGYFDMSLVSKKRIFITNTLDVPVDIDIPSAFPDCLNGADTIVNFNQIPHFTDIGYLISFYNFGVGYIMALKTCVDCRLKGSNNKPEFWD